MAEKVKTYVLYNERSKQTPGREEVRRSRKKRKKTVLATIIVIVIVGLIGVQYLLIWLFGLTPRVVDVAAIEGEILYEGDFVRNTGSDNIGLENTSADKTDAGIAGIAGIAEDSFFKPVFDISSKFITEPDTLLKGEQTLYLLLYNKSGYVYIGKTELDVVEGSLKAVSENELKADEITAANFIDKNFIDSGQFATELVSVSGPEFDAETGMYIYSCVLRLGERDLPCELGVVDRTPPVITGVHDIEVAQNSSILFREGIEVSDNFDKNVILSIETDALPAQSGLYSVTYRARDESGNEAEASASVKVTSAEADWVYEKVDEILATIITDNMDLRERARAVYNWVRKNIRYGAAPHEEDAVMGAYQALSTHYGDCFTFYAISEVLLTAAGVPNMRITRIPESPVDHFWNLVNVGDGWYHFDTCPPFVNFDGFMFTESQAQVYAEWQRPYRLYYFDYIKEDYPEIVQE